MKLLVLALVCGCTHPVLVPPPEPVEPPKGDVERVCEKLRVLECEEGQPTPEGSTCEEVLNNAAKEGIDLVGNVECTLAAETCAEARTCE